MKKRSKSIMTLIIGIGKKLVYDRCVKIERKRRLKVNNALINRCRFEKKRKEWYNKSIIPFNNCERE
jgi:hypothetical protein